MCKTMEDTRNEAAREAEKLKAIRIARLMLENGTLSYKKIAAFTELTVKEVQELDGKRSA